MTFWCALLLAVQAPPPGDPPPAPLPPADVADVADEDDAPDGADDERPLDEGDQDVDQQAEDGAPRPDPRTEDGEPVDAPPRPVSTMQSVFVGALGAAAGAVVGAVPTAYVVLAAPSTDDGALLAMVALSVLPSGAAMAAGLLAVFFVLDKPTLEDVAGVVVCAGISCLGVTVAALLAGLGAGGAGCGGGGGNCGAGFGSCGSGNACSDCGSGGGGDPLESPAVSHAGGAALGAIVGIAIGVALIAVEMDSTPRVRQEAIVLGSLAGAGAGIAGAVIGGSIGGGIGADLERDRRQARVHELPSEPGATP